MEPFPKLCPQAPSNSFNKEHSHPESTPENICQVLQQPLGLMLNVFKFSNITAQHKYRKQGDFTACVRDTVTFDTLDRSCKTDLPDKFLIRTRSLDLLGTVFNTFSEENWKLKCFYNSVTVQLTILTSPSRTAVTFYRLYYFIAHFKTKKPCVLLYKSCKLYWQSQTKWTTISIYGNAH